MQTDMNTAGIAALILVTVSASLVLLPPAENADRKATRPAIPLPVEFNSQPIGGAEIAAPRLPDWAAPRGQPVSTPIATGPVPGRTGSNPPAGADNWVLALYPELAQIIELENEPRSVALDSLLPMLSDEDPVVRLAALESLADLGSQTPLPALTAALDDPSPQIRIAALEALMLRRNAATVGPVEARVFDRDAQVRIAAIDALAVIGERSSVAVLGALLGDPDPAVRRSAVGALADIGGESARLYLRQLRHHPDDSTRASSEAILAESEPAGAL